MKSKLAKISPIFENEMKEILNAKRANNTLRNIPENRKGIPIITEKIRKAEEWQKVKRQLIETEFEIKGDGL